MAKRILALSSALALGGCYTTVQITATNPEQMVKSVTAEELNDAKRVVATTQLGDVAADAKKVKLDPVNVYWGNVINIRTVDGFQSSKTIQRTPDPALIDVVLQTGHKLIDDATGTAFLKAAFQDCGEPAGFAVSDMDNALASLIGKVVIYQPGTTSSPDPLLRDSIPPGTLSGKMTADQLRWSGLNTSETQTVTTGASTSAKGSIPVYGSVMGSMTSKKATKYHIESSGMGIQQKPEDPGFNVIDAMNKKLTPDLRKIILSYFDDPNTIMIYLNQFYGIRNFRMEYSDATDVKSAANVTALTVFTAEGAYNFDTDSIRLFSGGNVIVNINGPAWRLKLDPKSPVDQYLIIPDPQPASPRLREVAAVAVKGEIVAPIAPVKLTPKT